ncbi:hypothetical protein BaRGS_00019454 [Batillaria attramentaria]|uniref:Uncharacterized protein n=1 Tax=Batillaria attramentaria TaxID=370345 RepID=A0ABD0KQI8_9CAEN
MAAAVRTRNSYTPVSVDDTGQDRLIRHESQISVTKPRRGLSVWTFLLLVLGLCVLFLLGFCLGFYVRESQSPVSDILEECGGDNEQDESKRTTLIEIHEDIMYRIRGEDVRLFMR